MAKTQQLTIEQKRQFLAVLEHGSFGWSDVSFIFSFATGDHPNRTRAEVVADINKEIKELEEWRESDPSTFNKSYATNPDRIPLTEENKQRGFIKSLLRRGYVTQSDYALLLGPGDKMLSGAGLLEKLIDFSHD